MAPLQRHRNVPTRDSDGPTAGYILAFAERQLLAKNGHERAFRLRPVYPRKRTFDGFMSVIGGIADIFRAGVYVRS